VAGKNEVTLTLVGDHDQLTRSMSEVGSAADRMQKTVGGASERMQGEAKELGQSFDRAAEATDTLDTRSMGARDAMTGMQDSMEGVSALANGDLFDGLLLTGAGVGDLASAGTNLLVPALKTMAIRMGVFRLAMLVGTAAVGAGAVALFAWGQSARHTSDDLSKVTEDLDRFVRTGSQTATLARHFGTGEDAVAAFGDKLDVATASWFDWSDRLNRSFDEISRAKSAFEDLDGAMAQLVDEGADADEVMERLAHTYQLNTDEVDELRGVLPKYTEAAKRAGERTRDLAGDQGDAATATLRHADSIKAVTDALKAQTDPLFAFTTAVQSADDARTGLNEAEEEFGRNSPEYEQAALDLAQAELDLLGATSDVAGEIDQDLLPTLEQMRDDGHLSAEAFDAIVTSAGLAKDAAEDLDGTRARVFVDTVHRTMFERAPVGGSRQAFHTGGTVPGAPGTEMLALVQAGERIAPVRAGGDGAALVVTVQAGRGPGPDAAVAELVLHLIRTGALQLHTSTTGQVVAA
jgi:hypothetical protein